MQIPMPTLEEITAFLGTSPPVEPVEDVKPYSYLNELKSKLTPEQYNALVAPLMYTANEAFGGKVQDYQAQLLMPIDTAKVGIPKQLEFEPVRQQQVDDGEGGSYTQTVGGNPKTPNVTGDSESGYRSEKPIDVNGVPVYANYDASGKLTGYEGDSRTTSWINGKQRIIGNWDASGMPKPAISTSRGAGFRGFVNDVMSDPVLGAAANIAASYFGGPLGTAALGIAQGKDLGDIAKNAAISYVAGQAAQGVSSGLAPELSSTFGEQAGKSIANVAGNVTSTAVRGGDPLQALITGGLGAGTAALASEIPGFSDMSKYQQQAVNKAILNTLQGKDPSQGLINEAIASGISAATNYSDAPSSELINQTTSETTPVSSNSETSAATSNYIDALGQEFTSSGKPIYDNAELSLAPSSELIDQTTSQQADVITQAPEIVTAQAPDTVTAKSTDAVTDSVAPSSDLLDDLQDTSLGTKTLDLTDIDANDQYYDNSGVGPITSNYFDAFGNEFAPDGTPIYDNAGTGFVTTNYFDALGNEFAPDGTPIYDNDPRSSSSSKGPDFEAMARRLLAAGTGASSGRGAAALSAAALGASLFDDQNEDGLVYTAEPVQNQIVSYNPQVGTINDGVAYGLEQLNPKFETRAAQGGIMSLARGGIGSYPAAKIDGNEFVLAAQKYGIPDDTNTLNRIVALVNQGMSPDDAAQKIAGSTNTSRMAYGGQVSGLGGYAAGGNPRLLRGPGDGMSDNIPATIAGKQPARLADGEFVVPADVVSHLGNGSTEAGANVLYQMMERVRKARTGNPKQGKQINAQKFVPRKGK